MRIDYCFHTSIKTKDEKQRIEIRTKIRCFPIHKEDFIGIYLNSVVKIATTKEWTLMPDNVVTLHFLLCVSNFVTTFAKRCLLLASWTWTTENDLLYRNYYYTHSYFSTQDCLWLNNRATLCRWYWHSECNTEETTLEPQFLMLLCLSENSPALRFLLYYFQHAFVWFREAQRGPVCSCVRAYSINLSLWDNDGLQAVDEL